MNTTITIHNIKLTSLSNANHKRTNLVILGPHPSASLVSIRIHNCVHETCATSSIKLWILNVNVNYTGHLPMLPHRCLCLQTLWRYIIYTRTRSSAIANRPHMMLRIVTRTPSIWTVLSLRWLYISLYLLCSEKNTHFCFLHNCSK